MAIHLYALISADITKPYQSSEKINRKMSAASASIMADSVPSQMPFPELMAFAGQPTHQEMTVISREMFQNLKVIASSHNSWHLRYLGIIMDPMVYATNCGGAFIPP